LNVRILWVKSQFCVYLKRKTLKKKEEKGGLVILEKVKFLKEFYMKVFINQFRCFVGISFEILSLKKFFTSKV